MLDSKTLRRSFRSLSIAFSVNFFLFYVVLCFVVELYFAFVFLFTVFVCKIPYECNEINESESKFIGPLTAQFYRLFLYGPLASRYQFLKNCFPLNAF